MDFSGVFSQNLPGFSGAVCTRRGGTQLPGLKSPCVSYGNRGYRFSIEVSGFRDNGHLEYYTGVRAARCGGKVEKEAKKTKKRLKMVKGLCKELSMLSRLGLDSDEVFGSVGEFQGKRVAEAAEVLLNQLEQLKAEEKELKKKRKQEKARLKAEKMKLMMNSDSSSSSSSSSSSDGETEVIDMNCLRTESSSAIDAIATLEPPTIDFEAVSSVTIEPCHRPSTTVLSGTKIEICMGNKCKKSGGEALLEEFQRAVGDEVPIMACKCMGKCRDGPNVRVSTKTQSEEDDASVRVSSKPMCIGVGLEDVDAIVSRFLGPSVRKDLILTPAT